VYRILLDDQTRALISPDYWGDIKEEWESGGLSGGALVGSLGDEAEAFFVKLHIIFVLKYNKQQLHG